MKHILSTIIMVVFLLLSALLLSSCEKAIDGNNNKILGEWWLESADCYIDGRIVETENVPQGEFGVKFKNNKVSFLINDEDEEVSCIVSRLNFTYEYDGNELCIWDILGISYITMEVSITGNKMVWYFNPETDDDWLWEALDEEELFEDYDEVRMIFKR